MEADSEGAAATGVILHAEDLRKVFRTGGQDLEVLHGVSVLLHEGETVAITGASGVGKSTLLHILGALDRPTEGRLQIRNVDVLGLDDDERAEFRCRHVGFVFQFHNLLPEFTALENVMMPALIARHADGLEARARELLERVGLGHRLEHRPGELSGGECQRVAVARALVMRPELVLADEPSGNLDHEASRRLHDLLRELARDENQAFLVMTHDRDLAASLDRTGHIDSGRLDLC
ncbi:MAG: ABC transporter ATP-binding protein [Candidatus Latescibacteria bacterium]|jgi:lipoprotein-releasing system ATP-binding protein|nr:lipoprotein-releasing system ATP-binding protein LolD [Gemmatimonadaceae bacterium]MDP7450489.1 ABC transporter ATP-binding protein [Candidatus Latescibacterota bacterium]MDP7632457.1 ABC transporter ATP-binding protein [Candidatus Latescibacterota bacterium]HJP32350.1 ABC transporter ATP-binding protein [Candidatus Latescibacterota bacterium]